MRHTSRKASKNIDCQHPATNRARRQHRWICRAVGISSNQCNTVRVNQLLMAVAFSVAIGSTAYTDHTQAAQAQPTQGQEQQQGQGQDAAPTYPLNLPRQSLAAALNTLSEQTDIQVLFPYDIARSHSIKPVKGYYSIEQALQLMLQDTGLYGGLTDNGVIAISKLDVDQNSKGKNMNTMKKSLLASTIAFFVGGGVGEVVAQEAAPEKEKYALEEIVVTATRRGIGINDTALSISAVSGQDIDQKGFSGMDDYLRITPGVNFVDRGVSQNAIVIRGIAADLEFGRSITGPTVGTYFGEAPISGLGVDGGGSDLKLVDMERVEILRGPQGTLYGSGSLSGTVRNIPNAPDLSEFEGAVKAEYSNTSGAGSDNSKFEGYINLPVIEDTLSFRAVFYQHDNSGYVDNVAGSHPTYSDVPEFYGAGHRAIDRGNTGESDVTGGRITGLWKVNDDLSVTLAYVDQSVEQDGLPYTTPDSGDVYAQTSLQAYNLVDNEEGLIRQNDLSKLSREGVDEEFDFTNLVVNYDFGWATLTSSSFWADQLSSTLQDDSPFVGGVPIFRVYGYDNEAFIEEIRLVSQLDGKFQYVVGYYYEDTEVSSINMHYFAGDDPSENPFGTPFGADNAIFNQHYIDRELTQKAIFGELSYAFNDEYELTVGARNFDYERETETRGLGSFSGDATDKVKTDEQDTNYKVNLSYTPDGDTLLYAQWAEGFRIGNTQNLLPRSLCDVDEDGILDGTNAPITDSFDSDTLENYELGAKLSLMDRRVQVNAALFRMNWDGIPLNLSSPTCFFTMNVNAGEAISQGFEIETSFNLNENVQLNFAGSYTQSELSKDVEFLNAKDGDPLPGSPDYSVSVGILYDFDVAGNASFIRGDYSYIGGFYNNLQETGEEAGKYGQLNVRGGVNVSGVDVELFANNLTDEDEITWVSSGTPDDRAYRLRPRTLGVSLGYKF